MSRMLSMQELALLVVSHMEHHGVRVMRQCEPCAVEKVDNGKLMVTWKEKDQQNNAQVLCSSPP